MTKLAGLLIVLSRIIPDSNRSPRPPPWQEGESAYEFSCSRSRFPSSLRSLRRGPGGGVGLHGKQVNGTAHQCNAPIW